MRLSEARTALLEAQQKANGEALEYTQRLLVVLNYAEKMLQAADPLLISPLVIDNMDGAINSLLGDLNSFNVNASLQYLSSASSEADELVYHIESLPRTLVDGASDVISHVSRVREAATNVILQIDERASQLRRLIDESVRDLEKLKGDVDQSKIRQDKIINDLQDQFLKAQEQRSAEAQRAMDEFKGQFDGLLEGQRTGGAIVCTSSLALMDLLLERWGSIQRRLNSALLACVSTKAYLRQHK